MRGQNHLFFFFVWHVPAVVNALGDLQIKLPVALFWDFIVVLYVRCWRFPSCCAQAFLAIAGVFWHIAPQVWDFHRLYIDVSHHQHVVCYWSLLFLNAAIFLLRYYDHALDRHIFWALSNLKFCNELSVVWFFCVFDDSGRWTFNAIPSNTAASSVVLQINERTLADIQRFTAWDVLPKSRDWSALVVAFLLAREQKSDSQLLGTPYFISQKRERIVEITNHVAPRMNNVFLFGSLEVQCSLVESFRNLCDTLVNNRKRY